MTTLATEAWTGTNAAAWPAQWTSMAGNTIQANRGRMIAGGGYNAQAAYLSGMTATADTETLVTIYPPTSGEWYTTVAARTTALTAMPTNAGFPNNGVAAQLKTPSSSGTTPSQVEIDRIVSGTRTQLSSVNVTLAADANGYRLRFRVQGANYSLKVWGASSAEPTAWTATVTDATPYLTAGSPWVGVQSGAAASAVTVDFDDLTVTDGVAVTVVGTATVGEVASGTSVTCNVPTGVVAGELLVVAVAHSEASAAVPDQAGWTTAAKVTTASASVQTALFYRVATASEPASYTFTGLNATAANRATAEMVRLSGVDTTTPLDVTPGTAFATGTSVTTPSVTTVRAGALMIYAVSRQTASAGDINAASGTTLLADTTGTGRRTILASEARPTAGATGTRAWTATDATSLGMPGIAAAFRAALPKIATLTEDFTTADSVKWFGYDANDTVTNGQLVQAVLGSYAAALTSAKSYDLTGSAAHVRLVQRPNVGNGTTEAVFALQVPGSGATGLNRITWYVSGTVLQARRVVGGTSTTIGQVTYNATTHQRFRIRESGGTVFWDTFDGTTWTQQFSWVPTFSITSLEVVLGTGFYGTEPSPGTTIWDDLNIAPLTLPFTETWTGTDGAGWGANWDSTAFTSVTPDIQGNAGRIRSGTTAFSYSRAYLQSAPATTDTELLVTFTFATQAEAYLALCLNADNTGLASDTFFPTNGYALQIKCGSTSGTGSVGLFKFRAGGTAAEADTTSESSSGKVISAGTAYKARFQRVSNSLRWKVWDAATSEPPTWTTVYTDTGTLLPAGRPLLTYSNGTAATQTQVILDDFTVAAPSSSDITPPSVPTGVTATATSPTSVTVTWTASTDAVGVAGYRVARGANTWYVTSPTLSYTDSGPFTIGSTYNWTVSAYDAAGNRSAESSTASATIPATANLDKLKLGAGTVGLRVGSAVANKAYIGTTQVWP